MIHASQLTKRTDDRELFSDVSFFLPRGSYTHLTGIPGSGKTTLLEIIAGRQRPDSGILQVNDIDMLDASDNRLPYIRREIGFVESVPCLLENHSTAENVRVPLEIAGFDERAARERVADTLEILGLSVIADLPVQRLTTDQRWLVACARATVHRPQIVLFDAVTGISDSTAERQAELANRLTNEGDTVLAAGAIRNTSEIDITVELDAGRSFIEYRNAELHKEL